MYVSILVMISFDCRKSDFNKEIELLLFDMQFLHFYVAVQATIAEMK